MEQFAIEFLKYGVVGLMAGIFFWLYMVERKDHQKTREALNTSLNDRLEDSKKNMENVTVPLSEISRSISSLSDKIEIGRSRR